MEVFFAILGYAAGCLTVFVIMYIPRRKANEERNRFQRLRRQLDDEWDRVQAKQERVRKEHDRLDRRIEEHDRVINEFRGEHEKHVRRLADFKAALQQWESQVKTAKQEMAARERSFDNRVISYDQLAQENQFLKGELKNLHVHQAFLEQMRSASQAGANAVTGQRDEMGRRYFSEVIAGAVKAMTASNLPQNNQKVRTAAERVRAAGVELTPAEERQALQQLQAQFEKAVRAQEEREYQARLREQIREEQQRERENAAAQEAARQAERERAAIAAALERALAQAHGQHAAEVDKLRTQLAEAEAKSQRAMSLAQQTKVGSVYVISNIGSFGEDVFKIGMSRRLDPMDRVKELGDASVPFPFDVHMMIRCEDAPALENALHKEFHHRRLNRMNLRKEFFRVSVGEIAAAVERHHGKVEYTADAEAIEYRNSLMATDADLGEVEQAFAAAGVTPNAEPDEE